MISKSFPCRPLSIIIFMSSEINNDAWFGVLNSHFNMGSWFHSPFHLFLMTEPGLKLFKPCFNKIPNLSIEFFRHRNIDLLLSQVLTENSLLEQSIAF